VRLKSLLVACREPVRKRRGTKPQRALTKNSVLLNTEGQGKSAVDLKAIITEGIHMR
jgi:hypothetical protein